MSRLILAIPKELTFNNVVFGSRSTPKIFTLKNEGDRNLHVGKTYTEVNFLIKTVNDSDYTTESTENITLGKFFENGIKYYKDLYGAPTKDSTVTGIYIGTGNERGGLNVSIGRFILDNFGAPIQANTGEGIEEVV